MRTGGGGKGGKYRAGDTVKTGIFNVVRAQSKLSVSTNCTRLACSLQRCHPYEDFFWTCLGIFRQVLFIVALGLGVSRICYSILILCHINKIYFYIQMPSLLYLQLRSHLPKISCCP